jgi:hypothetical protein
MIDVATTHKVDFKNSSNAFFSGNPFVSFMQILSATPNSQQMYASALEAKAASQPEILHFDVIAGLVFEIPESEKQDCTKRICGDFDGRVQLVDDEELPSEVM